MDLYNIDNNIPELENSKPDDLNLHPGCANEENSVTKIYDNDFTLFHSIDHRVINSQFKLHTHDNYVEVLLFLEGNADFYVEGNVYHLEPGDIILVHPNEFHRVVHKTSGYYERIVLFINNRFFLRNNCKGFKDAFANRNFGEHNIIRHNSFENTELSEIIKRMDKYASSKNCNMMIVKNTLIEFLYVLSQQNLARIKNTPFDNNIRNIVVYINNHLLEDFDLEKLANKFFMSKYHLCRIFKKNTGFTINQYITNKRLALVKDFYENGMSLSDASVRAGFKSYSSFYRAYVKEMGGAPKKSLKNQTKA